jgi:hypothetical protein
LNFFKLANLSAQVVFTKRDIPLLPQLKQEAIHSGVAKLLYLSTRVRPDIALAVNYLCTQVGKFDSDDEKTFNRVLEYLHASPTLGITLECPEDIPYIDCSIIIGKGSLTSKSTKQKIVTKPSTESELVACSDVVSIVSSIKSLVDELKFPIKGVRMHQDNQSTIHNKKPTSQRTKHIDIRYFFLSPETETSPTSP